MQSCGGAVDPSASSLISRLVQAHVDGFRLARAVLASTEAMDTAEAAASLAIEMAATCPWDEAAADRAVVASSLYEEVAARETQATVEWAAHRVRVGNLLDEAEALVAGGQRASGVPGAPLTPF